VPLRVAHDDVHVLDSAQPEAANARELERAAEGAGERPVHLREHEPAHGGRSRVQHHAADQRRDEERCGDDGASHRRHDAADRRAPPVLHQNASPMPKATPMGSPRMSPG